MTALSTSLVGLLPPAGQRKVERLEGDRLHAQGAAKAAMERLDNSYADLQAAETEEQRIEAAETYSDRLKGGSDLLQRSKERTKAKKAKLALDRERYERADTILQGCPVAEALLRKLDGLIKDGKLVHHQGRPAKGATVATVRADIRALDDKIAETAAAPAPVAALRATTIVAVDALVEPPPLDRRIRGGRDPFKLAENALRFAPYGSSGSSFIGDGGRGFFVWVLKDQILAKLLAEIGDKDAPDTLSDVDRAKALARLAAEKLALVRVEEALIVNAEANGQRIARRPDADPLAVLELEIVE